MTLCKCEHAKHEQQAELMQGSEASRSPVTEKWPRRHRQNKLTSLRFRASAKTTLCSFVLPLSQKIWPSEANDCIRTFYASLDPIIFCEL